MNEAQPDHRRPGHDRDVAWWRRAVVHQVDIRSFGDGTDGIAGLRSRLPRLAALGVDAVALTPSGQFEHGHVERAADGLGRGVAELAADLNPQLGVSFEVGQPLRVGPDGRHHEAITEAAGQERHAARSAADTARGLDHDGADTDRWWVADTTVERGFDEAVEEAETGSDDLVGGRGDHDRYNRHPTPTFPTATVSTGS